MSRLESNLLTKCVAVIAVVGALHAVSGSGEACAADVVVCPEKAAIQLASIDNAVQGKARVNAIRDAYLKAAGELQLHLKLISGVEVPIVTNGAANAEFVFHVGEAPQDDRGPFEGEEARWRINGKGAWFYGDIRGGAGYAVTDFLEEALNVGWPWLDDVAFTAQNPIRISKTEGRWRPGVKGHRVRKMKNDAAPIWTYRMRSGSHDDPKYGHAFVGYGKRFAKTHPEWFAMRPDGLRIPFGVPASSATNIESYVDKMDRMAMCVTAPGLAEQVVDDWKKSGAKDWINVCENDVYGNQMCQCANCKALDMPHPDSEPETYICHLADRYINFSKRVVALARETNPRVKGCMYAYLGTTHPPQRERIENDELAVLVVPGRFSRPYIRNLFSGWKAAGFNLFGVRPNRHGAFRVRLLPMGSEKYFFEEWQYEYKMGAQWFDFDTVTKTYVHEYFRDYVLMKAMQDPSKDFSYWEDRYMEMFGAAKDDVREWFRYWREEVWEKHIDANVDKIEHSRKGNFLFIIGILDHLGEYYRDEDFDAADAILRRALARPGLDATNRKRVELLAEHTRGARLLYRAVVDKSEESTRKLYEYRKAQGLPLVTWEENYVHDITGVKAYIFKHAPEDINEDMRRWERKRKLRAERQKLMNVENPKK